MTQRRDFASALHGAITASGLTLDRIVHRLAERGFALGTAPLSHWSRGRSRRARPEALAAPRHAELLVEGAQPTRAPGVAGRALGAGGDTPGAARIAARAAARPGPPR